MSLSSNGKLRGKAAVTHNREIRESLTSSPKWSDQERIEFLEGAMAEAIRLARSWKHNPLFRHGHIKAAKQLRDEIALLRGGAK